MFATVTRSRSYRRHQGQAATQGEEKPEPGTDSTYGVRSLESVEGWDDGDGDGDGDGTSMSIASSESGLSTPDDDRNHDPDLDQRPGDVNDKEGQDLGTQRPSADAPGVEDTPLAIQTAPLASPPVPALQHDTQGGSEAGTNTSPTTSTHTITADSPPVSLSLPDTASLGIAEAVASVLEDESASPGTGPIPLLSSHLAYLAQQGAATNPHSYSHSHSHSHPHSHAHAQLHLQSPPSSPASLASIPSYVASASSLSRMSSPGISSNGDFPRDHLSLYGADDHGDPHQHANHHRRRAEGLGFGFGYGHSYGYDSGAMSMGTGSEELVLPMLNLPSSSLQGLPRWQGGRGCSLKAIVLGSRDETRRLIEELREEVEVVQLGKDEIGVVRGGKIAAVLMTGLDCDEVERRVLESYTTLHGMLHPSPSREAQGQIAALVATHGTKAEAKWVHLVVALDAESRDTTSLPRIVPVVSTLDVNDDSTSLLQFDGDILQSSGGRGTPSPPHIPDPTPRCAAEGASYFATHEEIPEISLHNRTGARILLQAMDNLSSIQDASTAKFFAWRPSPATGIGRHPVIEDLTASNSSHGSGSFASPLSGSSCETPPLQIMPTVARAQGGGEWEANLSRRMAKRREDEVDQLRDRAGQDRESGRDRARGKGRRKSGSKERERLRGRDKDKIPDKGVEQDKSCAPLFPVIPVGAGRSGIGRNLLSDVGLGNLADKVFKGVSGRWKWGAVAAVTAAAAAVLVAVGLNWTRRGW